VKILHTVQRYAPDIGGSEEVVKQLSEHLVVLGHEVTVATSSSAARFNRTLNGVMIQEFRCSGNEVEGIYGEVQEYTEFLKQFQADVMMNYAAQIWSTDLAFRVLPELRMKRVLVPCGYSRLNDPLFVDYFKKMPAILRQYEKVVYLSDEYVDTEFGSRHGLTNGVVIPNGADLDEFQMEHRGAFRARYGLADRKIILNVSNHSSLKGHAFFWGVVGRLRDLDVAPILIGNPYVSWWKKWLTQCYTDCRVSAKREGTLLFEGAPRTTVVKAYADADVFLFGSKVECSPLVMFEAFASRTLFVATDCGNVKDYKGIVCIVNSEDEAVHIIRDFCADPSRYRDRLDRGRHLFLQRLNWDVISRQYEALYKDLLR